MRALARRTRRTRRRLLAAAVVVVLACSLPLAAAPAYAAGGSLVDHATRASEGGAVTFEVLDGSTDIAPGSVRLLLDGLPPGTTLTADGRRAIVPGQGTWQVSQDGTQVAYTPVGGRIGREPSPVQYTAQDTAGDPVAPAVLSVVIPLLPDMVRAAAFGAPVAFPLSEVQQGIDAQTLELVGADPEGVDPLDVQDDGTRATVRGQGTWTLDRSTLTVTFTPADDAVRAVDPVLVRGADAAGLTAAPGILRVGYPSLQDLHAAEAPGSSVQFPVLDSSRNVRADSLAFDGATAPAGSTLTADGRSLSVPDQGVWTVDLRTGSVTFAPVPTLEGDPTPVPITGGGLFDTGNTAGARLSVQYAVSPPVTRGDQLRTAPGHAVSVDLLANDTPGRASDPLDPASVRLFSPDAVDPVAEGHRIAVPGQGVYTVGSDGVVTFTPEKGFVGRATPVEYLVTDSAGITVSAPIAVDVDPDAPAPAGAESGGITSLLQGLEPRPTSTFAVFGSMVVLLLFAGTVSLWIGGRMEDDRRSE